MIISAGALVAAGFVLKKLCVTRDKMLDRIPNIPGPVVDDDLYKEVLSSRHHGMIKVHEKYGELFQFPSKIGPIVFIRGADELENVFDNPKLGKNASTWGVIDGAVDVSNLVQPMLVGTFFEWEG